MSKNQKIASRRHFFTKKYKKCGFPHFWLKTGLVVESPGVRKRTEVYGTWRTEVYGRVRKCTEVVRKYWGEHFDEFLIFEDFSDFCWFLAIFAIFGEFAQTWIFSTKFVCFTILLNSYVFQAFLSTFNEKCIFLGSCGLPWSHWIPLGPPWSPLVPLGSSWSPLVPLGISWFPSLSLGPLWSPLVPLGSPWSPYCICYSILLKHFWK